jgi:transcription elongation factor Elf1
MTDSVMGTLDIADMILSWNCPVCNYPGLVEVFRVYQHMRVSVICAKCDLQFLVGVDRE